MEHLSDKFRFEQSSRGTGMVIFLKGFIDEDTNFNVMTKLKGPVVFNFKDVTGINSCGIRAWVNYIKDLGEMDVHYEECPPLVVRQMNMIPSFVGHATVVSVFVPYVCNECESEKLVLSPKEEFKAKPLTIKEAIPCAECKKGEMEIDGSPQQYFAFAR